MAKNSFADWDTTASSNTDVGGVNIDEGCAPSGINNAIRTVMAQLASGVDPRMVFTTRTTSYTPAKADNNKFDRYTVAQTVPLTAAATLGANWHYTFWADGVDIIIDPNGADTVNGAATFTVPSGSTALIYCDGTAFFAPRIEKFHYVTKSAGYTALPADNASFMRVTATATLALTAAATLTAGWWMMVIADGGNVTIDPNGAETVDGATTLVVPNGSSVVLMCSGTAFFTSKLSVPVTRQVIAGNGLDNGGALSANVTLTLGTPSTLTSSTGNSVSSTSHTHAVDEDSIVSVGMAALPLGAVGTLAFCRRVASGNTAPGDTIAGSGINYASASGVDPGMSPNGTWRCLGNCNGPSGAAATTLFVRIS